MKINYVEKFLGQAVRLECVCVVAAMLAAAACGAAETVCFEAESADVVNPPMIVLPSAATNMPAGTNAPKAMHKDASGGKYLDLPEGAGYPPKVTAGSAVYSFDLKAAGEYVLWFRSWWDDECGNSVTVVIDNGSPFVFGQDSTFKGWHWVPSPKKIKQLSLAAGKHTLELKNREDGLAIDQILVTDDHKYVPVGIETATVKPGREKEAVQPDKKVTEKQ